MLTVSNGWNSQINDSFWIGDTGATHHITNSLNGMFNLRKDTEVDKVQVGNGCIIQVESIGTYIGKHGNNKVFAELYRPMPSIIYYKVISLF